eukprot:g8222.t1
MSSNRKRSLLDCLPAPTNKTPKSNARKSNKTKSSPEPVRKPKEAKEKASVVAESDNELYRVQNHGLSNGVDLDGAQPSVVRTHDPDEVFLKALERERNYTRQGSAIEIKEISQDNLKQGPGGVQREADSLALALGVEEGNEVNVGKDSDGEPLYQLNKEAYKKHQIGTLYHTMKKNEVKLLRKDAQNAKMKRETERKYGWR